MKKSLVFLAALVFLAVSVPCAIQESPLSDFPGDFKDKAFSHVEKLASMGVRPAGSEAEAGAAEYIARQWESIGLNVRVEPFEFESYDFSFAELRLSENRCAPVWLGINPYAGEIQAEGEALLFDPGTDQNALRNTDLKGKVVISSKPELYFQLLFQNPAMLIFLNDEDFPKDKAGEMEKFELSGLGRDGEFLEDMCSGNSGTFYGFQSSGMAG